MKFKYQSFVDVATSATSMQVIQWSVGGQEVINRCRHLFGAYKYFKLGKISVKMVPASTLPVDPQGLSYDADDPQTVDPRDQMNPGLVRITNGEDIYTNVSTMNSATQEKVYQAMMLDPRWSKFMLQSGFRRTAYPLYWQVGQLSQDKFPGATVNVPLLNSGGSAITGVAADHLNVKGTTPQDSFISNASSTRGLFQVGHRGKMGFLPTDFYQEEFVGSGTLKLVGANNVPEVSVITCVLPKAYKTLYYYRVFITEEVIFAGLKSSPPDQYLGLDQFGYGNFSGYVPGTSTSMPAAGIQNHGSDMP